MKKIFLVLFALIGMSVTNLQAQFYVYKGGKIIYQINDSRPDSILFEKPATPGLHGRFVKATECNESNDTNARPANNYITFNFDLESGTGTITINNIIINCCDTLSGDITTSDNTITLTPKVTGHAACNCLCSHSIIYEISGIEEKKYRIIATDIIDTTIDLSIGTSGRIIPSLNLDSIPSTMFYDINMVNSRSSECKGSPYDMEEGKGVNEEKRAENSEMFKYDFDLRTGNGTITFINFESNCCDSLKAKLDPSSAIPYIKLKNVSLKDEVCKCLCTYDITASFRGMKKREYTIEWDNYKFKIDLSASASGIIYANQVEKLPIIHALGQCSKNEVGNDSINNNQNTDAIVIEQEDSVKYSYNPEKELLSIKYFKRVSSCCTQFIYTTTIDEANNITVTESMENDICDCICPFDIELLFNNMKTKKYTIKMYPYKFVVDLTDPKNYEGVINLKDSIQD